MWSVERPDGGRGFGFTGAHFHDNWGNDNFRKMVLNALVWIAKGEVPANGIESTSRRKISTPTSTQKWRSNHSSSAAFNAFANRRTPFG